jgi:hypothetical protein
MVEKIDRLELKGCERQLTTMLGVLKANREEFSGSGFILDFEKEWIEKYV